MFHCASHLTLLACFYATVIESVVEVNISEMPNVLDNVFGVRHVDASRRSTPNKNGLFRSQ